MQEVSRYPLTEFVRWSWLVVRGTVSLQACLAWNNNDRWHILLTTLFFKGSLFVWPVFKFMGAVLCFFPAPSVKEHYSLFAVPSLAPTSTQDHTKHCESVGVFLIGVATLFYSLRTFILLSMPLATFPACAPLTLLSLMRILSFIFLFYAMSLIMLLFFCFSFCTSSVVWESAGVGGYEQHDGPRTRCQGQIRTRVKVAKGPLLVSSCY